MSAPSSIPTTLPSTMLAARVHRFGPPEVIAIERVATPKPGPGEALVRVLAAGVGPWDALIREGGSDVSPKPPLTPGSDICGEIAALGEGAAFRIGDLIYGLTNSGFVGGYAEYAVAKGAMIALKPGGLSDIEAASAPVVGVTALTMLWERARLEPGQSVLIHGATGAVGGYAVPMAKARGVRVLATARPRHREALDAVGVDGEVDLEAGASPAKAVDAALDLVGGASQPELFRCIKPGGALVSAVSPPDAALAKAHGVRPDFFIVEVDTARLDALSDLIRRGVVRPVVGAVLPLADARKAHELMEGPAHPSGKIVLQVASAAAGRGNA